MQYLGVVSKNDRMILVCFKGKLFKITIIQFCAPNTKAEEAEFEQFYEDLQKCLELTPKKRCPLYYRGLGCKSRKSESTQKTGKFGLGVQNEPRQRLAEFCQEKALVIPNMLFQQHKRQLYTWMSPDGQYQIRLITFLDVEDGEGLYSQ